MTAAVSDKPWSALDTLLIAALTALGGGLRFVGITRPGNFVFDEHYAADACLYVFGPQPFCLTTTEIGFVHPPLARWLIGIGIRLFGFNTAGWRVAPLVAGTLSIALLYLLAREIFRSTTAATVAAGLLAFDFLHFVLSRTAMLDIFVVFFGLASFVCLAYDARHGRGAPPLSRRIVHRLAARPWLIGAGLAGGAAVACKWSGGYLLIAVALLAYWRECGPANSGQSRFRPPAAQGVLLFVALAVVPAVIYVASYAGRLDGALLVRPWAETSWVRAFIVRQTAMLTHHTGPLYVHPYMSPAWSWLSDKRPVLFYFRDAGAAGYQEILGFGNPLVWWTALVALAVIICHIVKRRRIELHEGFILAGFAAGYVPWFVLSRQEAFLYYILPAVPFLYLGLAYVVVGVSSRYLRVAMIGGLAVASLGMFLFFRPVLVGTTLTYQEWERRMLFSTCGPTSSGSRKRPIDQPTSPPTGWCWV